MTRLSVKSLEYDIRVRPEAQFQSKSPKRWDTPAGTVEMANNSATVRLHDQFATLEEAHSAVGPYLRVWGIWAGLWAERGEVSFERPRAVFTNGQIATTSCSDTRLRFSVAVAVLNYPDPPIGFMVTPDVETLWHRYSRHLDGREPLQSMAYFCLTMLCGLAGSRQTIPQVYNIEKEVIDVLGDLVSELGDDLTGRKVKRDRWNSQHYKRVDPQRRPLTTQEIRWIEATVRRLICRVGERAYEQANKMTAGLPMVSMMDLPSL
jgi:hypothetical protein